MTATQHTHAPIDASSAWARVPLWLPPAIAERHPRMLGSALAVYVALQRWTDNTTGRCWPSQRSIGEQAGGLSVDTVGRALKVLREIGAVTWAPDADRSTMTYTVHFHAVRPTRIAAVPPTRTAAVPPTAPVRYELRPSEPDPCEPDPPVSSRVTHEDRGDQVTAVIVRANFRRSHERQDGQWDPDDRKLRRTVSVALGAYPPESVIEALAVPWTDPEAARYVSGLMRRCRHHHAARPLTDDEYSRLVAS